MDTVYVEYGQSYNGMHIREGQCPHCGSDDLDTHDLGMYDNQRYDYNMECNSCKGEWTDTYLMVFSSMQIKSKE